jgi:phage shock protein PspC (stress-responsive transcriptional regulator)
MQVGYKSGIEEGVGNFFFVLLHLLELLLVLVHVVLSERLLVVEYLFAMPMLM